MEWRHRSAPRWYPSGYFRSLFRSDLIVVRDERQSHSNGPADLVGDAQAHKSEASKSNINWTSFLFALFEVTEHIESFFRNS